MHGRIDVAEFPLISGQLTARVHIPFAGEQHELFLGEVGIDERQRDAVKCQIPSGIPWVFPLVGHGDDVCIVQMRPLVVTAVRRSARRRRLERIAFEPAWDVVMVKLLAPDHAGEGLALHLPGVVVVELVLQATVKLVGFARRASTLSSNSVERPLEELIGQTQAHAPAARGHIQYVVEGCLRPAVRGFTALWSPRTT